MTASIEDKFTNTINKCDICFGSYDRSEHQPVIICTMHHTICKSCMKAMINKPVCPFCRESVRFDKMVINNYIFELLPPDEVKANVRMEANSAQYQGAFQNIAPALPSDNSRNFIVSQQENIPDLENPLNMSINNRSLERVFPQDYQLLNQNFYHNPNQVNFDDNQNAERLYDYSNANYQRFKAYCGLVCYQLPFTFFNLYFALTEPQSQCMDKPHRMSVLFVRPWFLGMGIIEIFLILILMLIMALLKTDCINQKTMQKCQIFFGIIAALKTFIWAIASINLFISGISQYCSGGVYVYGLVLAILHGLLLLFVCCYCRCN